MTILAFFILGLIVGSFLNMLIDRIPREEDIIFKRSHCDKCGKTLGVYDLVPVVSYVFLEGRCRYCRKKISLQNPLVELASGFLFLFIYQRSFVSSQQISNFPIFIYLIAIFCALLVIFVVDLKEKIIPDQIIIFLLGIELIWQIFIVNGNILINLLTGGIFSLFFLLLVILTAGRGMGMGDVKLALFMGLFLGFPKIIVAFYLAFLTGTFISLILVLMKKKTFKSTIAFGPFLILATFISYFYGEVLINLAQKMLFGI